MLGEAYVFSGRTGRQLHRLSGETPLETFGASVAGVGDVNKDGRPDVAIGSPCTTGRHPYALLGEARVYSGRSLASPDTGTFSVFGTSCRGSLVPGCTELNGSGGVLDSRIRGGGGGGVLEVPRVTHPIVYGFELYTKSYRATPATVRTVLFLPDANGKPGEKVRIGTLTAGSRPGWYATRFDTPLFVRSGQKVFIGVEQLREGSIHAPAVRTGTPGAYWYLDTNGPGWIGPFNAVGRLPTNFAWRIRCAPEPELAGHPDIGHAYTVILRGGLASRNAVLITGASRERWGAISLPWDLGFYAPGCALQVSADFLQATANQSLQMLLPNDARLVGARLYHQWSVADPAGNRLGVVNGRCTREPTSFRCRMSLKNNRPAGTLRASLSRPQIPLRSVRMQLQFTRPDPTRPDPTVAPR